MLSNILNIEGTNELSREQQKSINGGNMAGDCAIFVRSNYGEGPGYWTPKDLTVLDAQTYYNNHQRFGEDLVTTGYCCASCPF
tara:strand:- start:5597 stop:5845 length:249 start_codon:yes stop_codon:yes gene_type:complete